MFHGKITATLFPITLRPPLSALANLGVVMFMWKRPARSRTG